jgi:hypothetical protein
MQRTVKGVAGVCALAVLVLAGCSNEGASPQSPPPTEQVVEPNDPFPVGSSGPYIVEAHCGVKFATIDGKTWATTPRNDGHGNPPAGWPDRIEGTLTRPSEDVAIFETEQIPDRLTFEPTDEKVPGCA